MTNKDIPKLPRGTLKEIPMNQVKKLLKQYTGFKGEFRERVHTIITAYGRPEFNIMRLRDYEFKEIMSDFEDSQMDYDISELREGTFEFEFATAIVKSYGFGSLSELISGEDTGEKNRCKGHVRNRIPKVRDENIKRILELEGIGSIQGYIDVGYGFRLYENLDISLLNQIFDICEITNLEHLKKIYEEIFSFLLSLRANGTENYDYLIKYLQISTREDFLSLFGDKTLYITKIDHGILQFIFESYNIKSIDEAKKFFAMKRDTALWKGRKTEEVIKKLCSICEVKSLDDFIGIINKYYSLLRGENPSLSFKLAAKIFKCNSEEELNQRIQERDFKDTFSRYKIGTLEFFIERFNITSQEEFDLLLDNFVGLACLDDIADPRLIERVFDIYGIHSLTDFLQHKISHRNYMKESDEKIIIGEGNVELFLYLFDLYDITTPDALESWYLGGKHIDRAIKHYNYEVMKKIIDMCQIITPKEFESLLGMGLWLFFRIHEDEFDECLEDLCIYTGDDIKNKLEEVKDKLQEIESLTSIHKILQMILSFVGFF